jgi:lipopolysaccharide assembly protein A
MAPASEGCSDRAYHRLVLAVPLVQGKGQDASSWMRVVASIFVVYCMTFQLNQRLVALPRERWHHAQSAWYSDCRAPGVCLDREKILRYLYIGLIVVFTAIILLFKFQNLQTATVSLFSASITLPMSVLVIGIYVLGMLTGGLLLALLRSWIAGAGRGN